MKFARCTFLIAAIYGMLVVTPEYFMEAQYGRDYPPPVTHPEHYYGFVGLALVFQLLFFLIAAHPIRLRPVMPIAILEKPCFTIPCVILYAQSRIPNLVLYFSLGDLVQAALFFIAFIKTPNSL